MKNTILSVALFFVAVMLIAVGKLQAQDIAFQPTVFTSTDEHQEPEKSVDTCVESVNIDFDAGQKSASFEGLGAYLATHIAYPEMARKYGIYGKVRVQVTIAPDGKLIAAKFINPIGFGFEEAAFAVLTEMPRWTPAMNYGIPVKGKVLVELDFQLR